MASTRGRTVHQQANGPLLMEPWKTPIVELPVDDSRRTVSYQSDPLGKAWGFLLKYAGLCFAAAILSAGLVLYVEADGVVWLILFGGMMFVGFLALGWMENLFSAEGIDRLRIRMGAEVQSAYVEAERDVELGRVGSLNRAEDIQQLSKHIEQLYLHMDAMRRDALHAPQSDRNRLSTFVAPETADFEEERVVAGPYAPRPPVVRVGSRQPTMDEMQQQVQRWFISAYTSEGLAEDGRVVRGIAPWTERGSLTPTDKERARDWIKGAGKVTGNWIVRYDKNRRAWYVNRAAYPTSGAVLAALDGSLARR